MLRWRVRTTGRAALRQRSAVALVLGALLAGCAADPLDAERARILRGWAADEGEALSVTLPGDAPPAPVLIERESTTLETAAVMAFAGAIAPWWAVATGGNLAFVELAVVLTPILAVGGAVYGIVTAEPSETAQPLDQVPGAGAELAAALQGRRPEGALAAKVVAIGSGETGRRWRLLEPDGSAPTESARPRTDAIVTIVLERLGFVRAQGEADLALTLDGKSYVAEDERAQRVLWRPWSHESAARPLAHWTADDDALIDRALDEATEEIARDIVEGLIEGLRKHGDDT